MPRTRKKPTAPVSLGDSFPAYLRERAKDEPLLEVSVVAGMLGISKSNAWAEIRRMRIPCFDMGERRLRIDTLGLAAWAESRSVPSESLAFLSQLDYSAWDERDVARILLIERSEVEDWIGPPDYVEPGPYDGESIPRWTTLGIRLRAVAKPERFWAGVQDEWWFEPAKRERTRGG